MSSDGINSEQLLWAIQNGDLVVLRDAVTSKQIDANHQIKNRPMAVIAADYGQLEILKYLHENAVDFNVRPFVFNTGQSNNQFFMQSDNESSYESHLRFSGFFRCRTNMV